MDGGDSVIYWWEFLRLQLNQRVRLVQAGAIVEFGVFGTAQPLLVPHHLPGA